MFSLLITLVTVISLMGCTTVPGTISTNTVFANQEKWQVDGPLESAPITKDPIANTSDYNTTKTINSTNDESISLSDDEKQEVMFLFLKGSLLEKQKHYDQATEAYEQALNIIPDSSYAHAVAGEVYLVSGEIERAIDKATQALAYNTNEVAAHRVMAEALISKGKWSDAIEHYEHIIKVEPDSPDVVENLALLYSQQKEYDKAIDLYRRLIYLNPSQAVLNHFKIATMLYQLNRFEEALQEYQTLSELIPDYYEVSYKIGNIYEMLNQPEKAVEAYHNAITKARNEQDILTIRKRLGLLYRTQDDLDQALQEYKKINDLEPNDFETKKILALLYVEKENFSEAKDIVQEIIDNTEPEFRFYLLQDEILAHLGQSEDGIALLLEGFERVIQNQDSENILAFLWALSRNHRLEQMQQHDLLTRFQNSLEIESPLEHHPRFLLAAANVAIFKEKNHKEAILPVNTNNKVLYALERIISALDKATENKNEDWVEEWNYELRGWYDVRQAFVKHHLSTSLVNAVQESLNTFPYEVELKRTMGTIHIDQKNWSKAAKFLEEARDSIQPGTASYEEVLFQLASVYDKMNRLMDVEELMTEAMELDPENAQAFNFLGYAFAERNIKLNEALNLVQKAVKLNPDDGNILDSLGWVYYRMNRYDEAAHYLEKAAEKEQNHPVILEHLGDVYQKLGKPKAVDYWRQALKYGPEYPFEYTEEFKTRIHKKIQQTESSQQSD